jgi:hypothetical protein
MPNPKTIEELLKMKPCPFEDGHIVTGYEWINLIENSPHTKDLILAIRQSYGFKTPFKMPDGYFHLPIGMKLGLPLGEWTRRDIYPLVKVLPFGVVKSYCFNYDFGIDHNADSLQPNDFDGRESKINILKQPPNLYNPLDHKEEVLMGNNSASEKQPAKETKTMKLPWQDISTLEAYYGKSGVMVWNKPNKTWYVYGNKDELLSSYFYKSGSITHWLPITPPGAPTVEAPIEPETVSVQEFAKQLDYGHWVKCSNPFSASDYRNKPTRDFSRYFQLYSHLLGNDVTLSLLQQIIAEGNPIYSRTTDPTTWLAHKAKQEGNQ